MPKTYLPLETRFFLKVNKEGPIVREELGKCWLWTGNKYPESYGQLAPVWGERLAHRWAYKHHKGEIPEGKMVRHKCDVRLCVNPDHLELGDAIDNVHDMLERNEKAFGRKITNKQVEEILEYRKSGKIYKEIAELYGVSRRTIEKICTGEKKYTKNEAIANPNLISEEEMASIRKAYKEGKSYEQLAKEFKHSIATIWNIVKKNGRYAEKEPDPSVISHE